LTRREQLRRAGRTGAAIAKIYLGYKGLDLIDRGVLHPLVGAARRRWHVSSARTLYGAARDLGGLLLKAGQFVGTRADVFPPAYIEELTQLQDRVPAHPYDIVRRVIEEELGAAPERVFRRFWRRPIASASLAQVHRATLPDGQEVAVKVQRPEIPSSMDWDFRNLRIALRTIERIEGPIGLRLLLDELEDLLPRELDFVAEAHSAVRMRDLFAADSRIHIPLPVFSLTTRRVLVSEYVPGIKITSRRRLEHAGIDPSSVADTLFEAYARQIFDHSFFHADPHPGNLFVTPAPESPDGFRITFVDFGLVQEVPVGFRAALVELTAGLVAGDQERTAEALAKLGLQTSGEDPDTLLRTARLLIEVMRRKRMGPGRGRYRDLGHDLTSTLASDPLVQIPPHLVLIARVVGLVSGVARSLGVRLDLLATLLPHLAKQP
jgi:predicted unusual protein kinase regulating ubiquinone biosynthesis (AarF/ABC1/UbiB family)